MVADEKSDEFSSANSILPPIEAEQRQTVAGSEPILTSYKYFEPPLAAESLYAVRLSGHWRASAIGYSGGRCDDVPNHGEASMRSCQTVILEAELMSSPSEAVVSFLRERAKTDRHSRMNDDVDSDLEAALLTRHVPLVTLALAKYGQHIETLRALYQDAPADSGLQLATLTNTVAAGDYFTGFPASLIGGDAKLIEWIGSTSDMQLSALFGNPKLQDTFLANLLEGRKEWAAVNMERLAHITMLLANNERMRTPYADKHMDGYAEYSHGSVSNAAWGLAERAPTTNKWAMALSSLYDRLLPDAFSIKEPLLLVPRWIPTEKESIEREAHDLERGWVSDYAGVRKGLARLALAKNFKLLHDLLASDDVALRSAAYAAAPLTADQLNSAYEKDGELVFNMAMHNHGIWRNRESRTVLREVAWDVVKNDRNSDLMAANVYNSIRDDLAKQHPEWFKEDDDVPTPEPIDEPATKSDVQQLGEAIAGSHPGFQTLGQALVAVNARLGWVWWFSLGALVTSLWRHF